jgi:TatD DNase family protein
MVNKGTLYTDIHTHSAPSPERFRIHNLYSDFAQSENKGFYSIGLHPWYINAQAWEADFAAIQQYSLRNNVIAIGECGLDKVTATSFALQQEVFIKQIQWAAQIQKPLIIHCVRAYDEVLQLLKQYQSGVPVIFHGFNKNLQLARQVISAGYYLSFGKALTKENIQETFAQLPIEKLFLETDDSPLSIKDIYHFAAKARSVSEETLSLQLQKNVTSVFGITF